MTSFSDLGLAAPILSALEAEGYTTPTPIQAQAIPTVLRGADLLGIAQTGTGKTAAFALPILHRLAADPQSPAPRTCRVLVLAPTRELASQIGESFRTYGRNLRLTVSVVFGGVGHRPQISAMARGVDILVATPGRLLDHMAEGAIGLGKTGILVLDEADQMLDLGFLPPIRRIVRTLPRERQNLFFSATMPPDIAKLADDLLRDPVKVAVARVGTAAEKVEQRVIHVEQRRKSALLAELLADPAMARTLVFTRTKRSADRVSQHLETCGIATAAIHGNKSQSQRERALEAFRSGQIRALVATDIAARGIDIDEVTHVVNFDLPDVPDAYVHRIGRTARAGAAGQAIAFCDPEERDLLRAIERLTRQAITASDRRGDASLAASASSPGRERQDRRQQGSGGNRYARTDGQGHRQGGNRPQRGRGDGAGVRGDASERRNAGRNETHRNSGDAAAHRTPRTGDDRRGPARQRDDGRPPREIGDVAFLAARSGGGDARRHGETTRTGASGWSASEPPRDRGGHKSRPRRPGGGNGDGGNRRSSIGR
ncbi:MAG: DEAD/DEAH box helicase [Hyphomicrobiaceae bacterium]|nr:DEAD/DEAH box helicase [Hyphomicrobiaceae bacterium]